ncbi:hypothetical protein LXA43DRAFT_1176993 [Ganoderma leucocontextum]|nr:hypothetical protein LXA43DRAFT_1176993 [Ganoderma leucocontextum]
MLKRQRSTPSFVPDAYPPQEPSIDMSERVVKRRRHFPPPQSQSRAPDKGKAPWRGGESDGEEDVDVDEQAAGRSAPSEYTQRLQHAGEYKHVNSLLHDLHAEQRHRMLFSTTSPPAQLPLTSHGRPHVDFHHPFPSAPNQLAPIAPLAPHESHRTSTSFMISIPSKDASIVDHNEVKRVTQQYEDTNRFLGALFLTRRRQCDGEGNQNQT